MRNQICKSVIFFLLFLSHQKKSQPFEWIIKISNSPLIAEEEGIKEEEVEKILTFKVKISTFVTPNEREG